MRPLLTVASMVLAGCSTITTMDGRTVEATDASCDVRVYQTYQAAIRQGPIEELCVITGTSYMSFVHTSAVAIEKHKHKACSCGANAVYVQSRHDSGGWDLSTVTLVAFRSTK